jgi:hypothetical protein
MLHHHESQQVGGIYSLQVLGIPLLFKLSSKFSTTVTFASDKACKSHFVVGMSFDRILLETYRPVMARICFRLRDVSFSNSC